jgi:hypothetical protein
MRLLFCRSSLNVRKNRPLEVSDGKLPTLKLLTFDRSPGSYYRCQVDVLESVTVRRSEHVSHKEDLKGQLAPLLPD